MTSFAEGDRNTKYFHSIVNGRRKRLQIKRIQNRRGIWIEVDSLLAKKLVILSAVFSRVVIDIRLRGKPTNVVLKLDMAKAYDRVSWSYLIRVLRKMGFAEVFIDMVWRLIANNWYSILLNSQASTFFHSTRGVKQGDPLSPALFILSAEVLSRALNSLFENNDFRSYGMPKWSASLNHLAYADDTIIFSYL
ncbi:secreted RxLR effector protein 78-like [Lycium ferocissimum]|uniref:secreted RxLR effector protein 78-like n=1 Tax=Lycium ferocissimum TaxID=112874 RepID=UPI00281590C1|nr:secreted RxLR effector protein 78-like [Lycium ferocissimum]